MLATMPFAVACGIVLDAATAEEVRGHLPWSPERCTTAGMMHGGAVMTLADTTGAICAFLNLPTTIVVQTELRDSNDKLVALVTQTQAVLTR